MKMISKWTFGLTLCLFVSLSFISCDNDDNKTPEGPTEPLLTDIAGDYTGNMVSQIGEETPSAPTQLSISVKNDTLYFDKFPADSLIKKIVNNDELAEIIIQQLGDIQYKIGFIPEFNTAKDSILFQMDPEMLNLSYEIDEESTIQVAITIEAPESGSYCIKEKDLKLKLDVTQAVLNGNTNALEEIGTISLLFVMNKDK